MHGFVCVCVCVCICVTGQVENPMRTVTSSVPSLQVPVHELLKCLECWRCKIYLDKATVQLHPQSSKDLPMRSFYLEFKKKSNIHTQACFNS